MKKNNGNIISILLIFLGIISMVTSVHAHSGKTDSNGGHRKGGGADDSIRNFIRCDWDNRITYLIWRFAHRITFLSR